jgi:predicted RNase H-like nuclease
MLLDDAPTLGIDLAAQAQQTAVCVVDWRGRPATVSELAIGFDTAAIVALVNAYEPAKIAVDAPFGWPAPFVAAVSQHAAGEAWEEQTVRSLRLRATDLYVIAETGQQPLSVSADRIAVTAFRCAGLLTALAHEGRQIDRAGGEAVIEAYPAAALRQWGMDARGYKGSRPEQRRRRLGLVDELTGCSARYLAVDQEQRERLAASDHLLDALVCALIARAALRDLLLQISGELHELAAVEGWIALPLRNSLQELG